MTTTTRPRIALLIDDSGSTGGNGFYVQAVNQTIRAIQMVANTPIVNIARYSGSLVEDVVEEFATSAQEYNVRAWKGRGGTSQDHLVPEYLSRLSGHDNPASLKTWQPTVPTLLIIINDGGIPDPYDCSPCDTCINRNHGHFEMTRKIGRGWLSVLHVTPGFPHRHATKWRPTVNGELQYLLYPVADDEVAYFPSVKDQLSAAVASVIGYWSRQIATKGAVQLDFNPHIEQTRKKITGQVI